MLYTRNALALTFLKMHTTSGLARSVVEQGRKKEKRTPDEIRTNCFSFWSKKVLIFSFGCKMSPSRLFDYDVVQGGNTRTKASKNVCNLGYGS